MVNGHPDNTTDSYVWFLIGFKNNKTWVETMYNGYIVSVVDKVLTHIEYRAVFGVFRTIEPPPPLRAASVPPHTIGGGGKHSSGGEGVLGVNILEDARHWIGLLQYNPSTL